MYQISDDILDFISTDELDAILVISIKRSFTKERFFLQSAFGISVFGFSEF